MVNNLPFYDFVYRAHNAVMDFTDAIGAEVIRDQYEGLAAGIEGCLGIALVVKGLQITSKQFKKIKTGNELVDKFTQNFDDKVLPVLEKICIGAMATAPLIYAAIDPDTALKIYQENNIYLSGMTGVYFGSIASALEDLNQRDKIDYSS